jgi:hypothetical protein
VGKIFAHGKEKEMATTIKRNNCIHKESYERPIQSPSEMRYYFVYSFKDKQMRENVVDTWIRPY